MALPASSDSHRPRNPYERLRREFLEAHDDFGGCRLEAYPLKETCKRRPPDFGLCELPGIEGFPSATYGLYAASSIDDALDGDEFAKALERFRSLGKRAGDLLPMSIRDALPDCGSTGTVGLWIRFLWYFGLPARSDRANLEWHFQQVGSGILSTCDGWLSPFRTSSVAIERCRLDTDSPAFFRLHEIPGLAQRAVPAIAGENEAAAAENESTTVISADVARLDVSGIAEKLHAALIARFGDNVDPENTGGNPSGASNTAAAPEASELDAAGDDQRATDEPPADDSTYLDLMVDESRRTISREGHGPFVDLSRREVLWHVFMVLYRQREHMTTREMIERGHPGSTEGPAIRNSLNQLRTLLIPLDVTVTKNDWRLVSGALESSNAISNGAHEGI